MSEKMSNDETSMENISIACRPMTIAEEFEELTSNAWLDAKTKLDEICPDTTDEKLKVEFLAQVMLVRESLFVIFVLLFLYQFIAFYRQAKKRQNLICSIA